MRRLIPWVLAASLLGAFASSASARTVAPYSGLDRSFGGGSVILRGTRSFPEATADRCVPGPNGEVLVELTARRYTRTRKGRQPRAGKIQLVKLTSRGKPVRDFGRAGRVSWSVRSPLVPRSIEVDAAGRLLLLSRSPLPKEAPDGANFVLTRLTPDGRLDKTFGVGGRRELGKLRLDATLDLMPDGRMTVTSSTPTGSRIAVLDESGSPASGFNAGQPLVLDLFADSVRSIQSGGIPVLAVAGTRYGPAPDHLGTAVVRFFAGDAKPAPVFGTNGELTINSIPPELAAKHQINAARLTSHGVTEIHPNTLGGLDLAVSSGVDDDFMSTSLTWVRRLLPTGAPDQNYGIGGAARLFVVSGQEELAVDEYSISYPVALADDAWLAVSLDSLFNYDTVLPSTTNNYFSAYRLAPDGMSIKGTAFNRTKQPRAAETIDMTPSTDGKSILWCGHTGFRTRSGRPHAIAWVARSRIG